MVPLNSAKFTASDELEKKCGTPVFVRLLVLIGVPYLLGSISDYPKKHIYDLSANNP